MPRIFIKDEFMKSDILYTRICMYCIHNMERFSNENKTIYIYFDPKNSTLYSSIHCRETKKYKLVANVSFF